MNSRWKFRSAALFLFVFGNVSAVEETRERETSLDQAYPSMAAAKENPKGNEGKRKDGHIVKNET